MRPWKLLSKDNKRAEDFIENGYRTARKYNGAYITITQGIEDFDGQKASGAAKAAGRTPPSKSSCARTVMRSVNTAWITRRPLTALSGRLLRAFRRHVRRISVPLCCVMVGQTSFHRLLLDPISRVMFSSDGEDFDYREAGLRAGKDIHDIIGELAGVSSRRKWRH